MHALHLAYSYAFPSFIQRCFCPHVTAVAPWFAWEIEAEQFVAMEQMVDVPMPQGGVIVDTFMAQGVEQIVGIVPDFPQEQLQQPSCAQVVDDPLPQGLDKPAEVVHAPGGHHGVYRRRLYLTVRKKLWKLGRTLCRSLCCNAQRSTWAKFPCSKPWTKSWSAPSQGACVNVSTPNRGRIR